MNDTHNNEAATEGQAMNKKYELTNETIEYDGRTLHRIKALRSIGKGLAEVKKGELGGYVETEQNLSQDGECWVYHKAKAYGEDTIIYEDAQVFGLVEVCGMDDTTGKTFSTIKIYGDAKVDGSGRIQRGTNINSGRLHI